MSGHSKWHTIKHKKGATDAKRGKIFTKLIKEITVAARTGGGDPDANARLRKGISDAKAANMPNDTIDRAVKRGSGELEGVHYDEITYEGYGAERRRHPGRDDDRQPQPHGRRAAPHASRKTAATSAKSGSVAWMFDKKGYIVVDKAAKSEDELFEIVIEAGADDMQDEGDVFEIYTIARRLSKPSPTRSKPPASSPRRPKFR